jgi:SAM-dependent methyltransferase
LHRGARQSGFLGGLLDALVACTVMDQQTDGETTGQTTGQTTGAGDGDEQGPREERWARSFGTVAAAYERGRPGYPSDGVRWLVGRDAASVLEVGAGTGKLTAELIAQGHDVLATEPDENMLAVLRESLPVARTALATAEELPAGDRSIDVVVAAQAFHWFDHDVALPEIARVLKPGGVLAMVWNLRDDKIPWVRRLGDLIGTQEQLTDPSEVIAASGLFEPVESQRFKHWQDINRDSVVDLVLSRSNVSTLPDDERAAKLAEVAAFYDDFGRGYDGMQLPYVTHCFRARVIDRLGGRAGPAVDAEDEQAGPPGDGSDSDMLLIDFR